MKKRNYNTDSYCQRCVWATHPRMLTGYCSWNARCTRCGHVSDLAMVVTVENLAAFDASVATLKKRRDDSYIEKYDEWSAQINEQENR